VKLRGLVVVAALFAIAIAACDRCGKTSASGHYILRVDQQLDRTSEPPGGDRDTDAIPESRFLPLPPEDRYDVTVSGDHITIVPLVDAGLRGTMEGARDKSSRGTRFRIHKGTFAGASFVIRGARGELTIEGSGVYIVTCERGNLIER